MAIVAALGLRMSDLFDASRRPKGSRRISHTKRPASVATVDQTLHTEIQRALNADTERLGYIPPRTSRHFNSARRIVSTQCGIPFPPVAPFWWEHAQYDTDPLWPILAGRALEEILREREGDAPTRTDYLNAEERAAAWLRALAHRSPPLADHAPRKAHG